MSARHDVCRRLRRLDRGVRHPNPRVQHLRPSPSLAHETARRLSENVIAGRTSSIARARAPARNVRHSVVHSKSRTNPFAEMAATMLRALFIMLVASYTNALIVGTRPAMVPKVQLRAQEAPPPPPKGKLGATVDQDGKSNVWVRCSPRVRRASRAPLRADSAPLTVHTQPTLCPHHHLHHHHHHHHQHHHHHTTATTTTASTTHPRPHAL